MTCRALLWVVVCWALLTGSACTSELPAAEESPAQLPAPVAGVVPDATTPSADADSEIVESDVSNTDATDVSDTRSPDATLGDADADVDNPDDADDASDASDAVAEMVLVRDMPTVGPFIDPSHPCVLSLGAEPSPRAGCDASDPALVLCLSFDADEPDVPAAGDLRVIDGSSYAGHGQAMGGVAHVAGVDGLALDFDGSGQVRVPDRASFDQSAGFTHETWVRLGADPPAGGRFGWIDLNAGGSSFFYDRLRVRCLGVSTLYSGDDAVPIGEWIHVACQDDGTTTRLFIDGQLAAEQVGTGTYGGPTGDGFVSIGQDAPMGDGLVGALDSMRMWRRQLSPEEICAAAATVVP